MKASPKILMQVSIIIALIVAALGFGIQSLTAVAKPAAQATNVALNKTATASSVLGGNTAAMAFDGNTGTRWESAQGVDPQWLQVDLGATYTITSVILRWETAAASAYTIQTSASATGPWTNIYSTTTSTGGVQTLTVSGSGRYVRMNGTARTTQWGYSLWEMEVYGTTGPAPTATVTRTPTTVVVGATNTATKTNTAGPTITRTNTATAIAAGCGTTNVAIGKTATASSIENAGTPANLAVDGNTGTRWSSAAADPQWLMIDLGASQTICRVKLNWEAAYATGFQIQVSNDAATWSNIYTTTTGTGGINDLTVSGSGRYVRMNGTTRATVYGYSLWEMDVYVLTGPTPTPTKTVTPSITPTQVPLGNVVPLFSNTTSLEPETIVDTGTALITRYDDRARDRHAREGNFALYDHYLSHYWEQRTAAIELIDRVAKGGTDITFNVTTQWKLSQPEFRVFFRGINTVAEYNYNALMTQVGVPDANGITNYTITVNYNNTLNRPIQIGDKMEIEISQFLDAPPVGRSNYYGTATLYIVGQGGMVPWEEQGALLDSFPLPSTAWQGGRMTLPYQYSNEPLHRFKQMAPNTAVTNGQPFMLGRRLFHTNFSDGTHSELNGENGVFSAQIGKLGPRFYAPTCDTCHVNDGGALPPALNTTISNMVIKVGTSTGAADPNLGASLQPFNNAGASEGTAVISSYTITNGTYGDGTAYQLQKPNYTFSGGANPTNFSVRKTPHLVGMGLLEAIAESSIAAIADPNDSNADGISGRMQTVVDPQTGQTRMGRFGWKAGRATVAQQTAGALNGDMGVTTTVFPNLDCGANQGSCGTGNEISNADLDLLRRYVSLLGVAARRNLNDAQVQRGETLFTTANCTACHKATLTTSIYAPLTEVRNQTIHPYTDLLLHDMGTGLADNLPEGIATGAEWRTAPLWSIGLTAGVSGGESYLHDGRARTLAEAILWHGGEANAAKEAFRTMNATDRAALIAFLMAQ